MHDLPNIRHLTALLSIEECGSISSAAEKVHLSQPALTQALNKIETAAGSPLFERSAAGMAPTEAGSALLERIRRARDYLRSMDKAVSGDSRQSGERRFHQLLTTAQLRALIAVVEQNSISLAAARLNLAQPSVQRAAREMEALSEDISGQPLFIRTAQGVDATALARRLARLASLALAEIRQGFDDIGELRGQMNGRLAIGSLPLARTRLVPAAVTRLLEQYPDARVSIVDGPYEQLLNDLLHTRVDLIIGALRPQPVREIEQEFLFDDPLSVVVRAGHPLAGKRRLSLGQLGNIDWIAPRQGTPARERFHRLFSASGLEPPRHVIECSSSVATRSLLLQSDRAALLSRRQVELELQSGLLALLPTRLAAVRPIGLSLRKHWKPTRIQARFLAILKDLIQIQ